MSHPKTEFPELAADARRRWDAIAEWWDDRIGDGNAFQTQLIEPSTERLLALAPGEVVLDAGCGAGRFARRMAELGAHVVAFDASERFIRRARQRTPAVMKNIDYHAVDGADRNRILALGARRFDAAVAAMALMDMPVIEPLISALSECLKPGGRFVFSVVHPCFQSPDVRKFAEEEETDGRQVAGVKVTRYIKPAATEGVGIPGQPEKHFYFHRPLSALFESCFRQGFVMDGMEEPVFAAGSSEPGNMHWQAFPEIPPALVVRMRLTG